MVDYVDGFAGAGTYGGGASVPGSPVMAAQLAANLAAAGKWRYRLRCINMEPKYFTELCEATSPYDSSLVLNLHGTFKEHLPEIFKLIDAHPTLFFLDPFGYKGMEWEAISQLAQRSARAKTELIINFNVGKVDRDAGWLDSYGQSAAPAFVQSLNELFGVDLWQQIIYSGLPKAQRDDELTELYANRLGEAFRGIAAWYPVRTVRGQLKYYVLHVTSHRRGCREMGDVLYRVDHDYEAEKERAEAASPRTLALFPELEAVSPREYEADLVSRLAEDIYGLGKQRKQLTFGALQDGLCVRWFAEAVERHYRRACQQLIRQRRIDRDKETGIEEKSVLRFV